MKALDRVTLVSDFSVKLPADDNQRSWDRDDAVIVVGSVLFLSQLNLHPGSVTFKDLYAWNRLSHWLQSTKDEFTYQHDLRCK